MSTIMPRLTDMQSRLRAQPPMARLGQLFSETVLLQVDDDEYYLIFEKGELTEVVPGPSRKRPYRFAYVTDAEAMHRFWQPLPEPGFHDLFAIIAIGRAKVLGDILVLVKNLRFFKEFMALGREEAA